ncbi:MAG: SagB family peptide dehydrogenase [Gammaproteobacteria bacterium]|nr:SagB family peptide dehydrogenase [Gammaproteobacteria bacterium]
MNKALDTVLAYHQRTKHHFRRYAAGPDGLDWANQPDPFRTFAGSPALELPLLAEGPQPRYADLYTPGRIAPQALSLHTLAALLELSFGLSAWKEFKGSRWALRCNPSSGNLHPTEAYVVIEHCPGVANGVHHYVSRDHVLEHRCEFAAPAHSTESLLPPGAFLIGLTSIHWREAWKYGERAYRYCQHDAGHAIAAVRYAAAALGWQAHLLGAWGDAEIGALLGTDRAQDFNDVEREHSDLILQVTTQPNSNNDEPAPNALIRATHEGHWRGQANRLSRDHKYEWAIIDEAAAACTKPHTQETIWQPPALPEPIASPCQQSATEIIKQRRSAQEFDGVTSITAAAFYRMLDLTLPRPGTAPWDAIAWPPRIHLLLFVHRVEGLEPGLYVFLRNDTIEATARTEFSPKFEWLDVAGCPAHFKLYRLISTDTRDAARAVSCHQDIAADGAFSLGMLAEYQSSLEQWPWIYRQLFWEAGILGQMLYLEAEAAGVRGTGIGCYFDDAAHDVLGMKGQVLQSMYHFTAGGALTDTRLQTLPGYAHLRNIRLERDQ